MTKLHLTETARVLHAALVRPTFTVEELAERAVAKAATVRTILFRSKAFVEEVASDAPPRAGRRSKRYRLRDRARASLSQQLADLTSELRPGDPLPDTSDSVDAALRAAESSLELAREAPTVSETVDWAGQARSQLDAARHLLTGVHDARQQKAYGNRLAILDDSICDSGAVWQKGEPAPAHKIADPQPVSRTARGDGFEWFRKIAKQFERPLAAGLRDVDLPCLWFDATDGLHDSWSQEIVENLLGAHCAPVRFPVGSIVQSDALEQSQLKEAIAAMPAECPVFVTMRSGESGAEERAIQLLHGPLQDILRVAGAATGAALHTVIVMDRDLPNEAFWLDHGIANLWYYPTANPTLAKRVAEKLVASAKAASEIVPKKFAAKPRPLAVDERTATRKFKNVRTERVWLRDDFEDALDRFETQLKLSSFLESTPNGSAIGQYLKDERTSHEPQYRFFYDADSQKADYVAVWSGTEKYPTVIRHTVDNVTPDEAQRIDALTTSASRCSPAQFGWTLAELEIERLHKRSNE